MYPSTRRRHSESPMSGLVLDAMGVILRAADDVAELLIPYIDDRTKNVDAARACGIDSLLFEPRRGFGQIAEWLSLNAPGA